MQTLEQTFPFNFGYYRMTQTPELRGIATKHLQQPPLLSSLMRLQDDYYFSRVGGLFAFPAAEASPDRDTSRI